MIGTGDTGYQLKEQCLDNLCRKGRPYHLVGHVDELQIARFDSVCVLAAIQSPRLGAR